jgi:hypothetical protein
VFPQANARARVVRGPRRVRETTDQAA